MLNKLIQNVVEQTHKVMTYDNLVTHIHEYYRRAKKQCRLCSKVLLRVTIIIILVRVSTFVSCCLFL